MFDREPILRTWRATINPRSVLDELDRRLQGDWTFSGGRVLGSMCSTPHPLALEAFQKYAELNAGDPGLVPGLAVLENEVAGILGSWWGNPSAPGRIVSGGTEANILALWTARQIAVRGGDKNERREVVLSEASHFSFDKAASLLGLTLVKVPTDPRGRINMDLARRAVGPRTLALVGIAGTTALGAVDDLPSLADLAREKDLYLHIDASFGGFVLPFLHEAGFPCPDFSWREGISSVALDPHKMGRGPIPSGCLLWKDEKTAEACATPVSYLSGGQTRMLTLTGTRPGASVAAVWAVVKHLGYDGYVEIVRQAMENTHFLTRSLGQIGGVEPVLNPPTLNVVGIRPTRKRAAEVSHTLREKGWALSLWPGAFRVVLMPHVTRSQLKEFLSDLEEALG